MSHKSKSQKKSTKNNIGAIRLIAGRWRGRKLPVHDVAGLRPTTDRVKETLFNWLSPYIANSRCLDLFAGSGSLGFEALSRGAKTVEMVELDARAAAQLTANLRLLKAENGQVFSGDAQHYLAQYPASLGGAFDLVFLDPPFRQALLEPIVTLLQQPGVLAQEALIYIEREKEAQLLELPAEWQLLRSKQAGQVIFELYQFAP